MKFNLTMLNLWIGLCRGVAGLPVDIKDLGYVDKWIEWKFPNQDRKIVCPDLIIASDQVGHTILLEFKSGANTDPDQLHRYSRVTERDLIEIAFISRDAAIEHDVTIVGESDYGERLRIGISNGNYEFPLLLKDGDGLTLGHNQFRIHKMNSLFSLRLEIDWTKVPSMFVPIDQDSEPWEVAEVVMPKILEYMAERRPFVSVEEICQDICVTWDIMGKPAKNQSRPKVKNILSEAARGDFRPYLRWTTRPRDGVEIIANPLDLQPDKRTAAYRRLRTAQKTFIENLRRSNGQRQLSFGFRADDILL